MLILALDPGGTTGYAVYDSDDNRCLEIGQFKAWEDLDFLIVSGSMWSPPDVVVYEDFRIYPSAAKSLSWQELIAPQVIGVIRYLCERHNVLCEAQMASYRKSGNRPYVGNAPTTYHERDALLHAIAYARRRERADRKDG